ncbi:MAG: Mg2+/citrate symporter [Polaribacter sp.]|jgi:Mg2+/citrate symporter
MKKIISKPHFFFFGLIPILLILGFLYKKETIDVNISYTYYVIAYHHLSYLFAVFFGLVGLNYFSLYWVQKKPIKWMTLIHIILQVLALLFFFTKDKWNWLEKNNSSPDLNMAIDYSNLMLILSILFFILSAFIHLINFFVSLISKSK